MKILAVDSSGLVASVAVITDEHLIGEFTVYHKKTHSQTLLPMIDEICKITDYRLEDIDAIAVSAGPGYFTGLRIGSATAKGLGLALKKPLIHIPTVEAMAYNFYDTEKYIVPIMDARRSQVYTGIYTSKEGIVNEILPQCIMSIEELIKKINEIGQPVVFLGDGVPVFREKIEMDLLVKAVFAAAGINRQRASAVAELGKKYFLQGKTETAAQHAPDYLRMSQAERERKMKDSDNKNE